MNRKRKVLIAVVSIAAVVIIAVATVLALRASHKSINEGVRPDASVSQERAGQESADENSVSPTDNESTFTQANATMLEKAMESRDKDEQAKALIPALRGGSWKPSDVLPDGARIKINRASFKPSVNGEATVDATVSGSVQAELVLSLVFVNDKDWLISTTKQK